MALTERLENIAYNVELRNTTLSVLYFRSTVSGTIKKITLYRSASAANGAWIFNVRQNASALFSGAGRPSFTIGVSSVVKSGLSIAVAEGDVLQLDLEQPGAGVLMGHLVLVVEIELASAVMTGPGTSTDNAIAIFDGTTGNTLQDSAKTISTDGTFAADSDSLIPTQKAVKAYVDASGGGGSGDVVGPASAVDGDIVLFDSTTGKLIKDAGEGIASVRSIPQNSQSADYTLVLADAGKHIFHPSADANARTFTIPANSSVAFPIGTAITFINRSANNVSIAITTDTLTWADDGTTGTRTLAQYGVATAIKISSTEWIISGVNLT